MVNEPRLGMRFRGSMFSLQVFFVARFELQFKEGSAVGFSVAASNCKIVMVDENCADALAEYTRFVGQNTEGKTGRVLLGAKIW